MKVVCVDLDDTLIPTKYHYEEAKGWFGDYLNRVHKIDKGVAVEEFSNQSDELVQEFQLSQERFPTAAVHALKNLVDNPSDKDLHRVHEIGRSAFKSKPQYKDIGFMDEGTEQFLETVEDVSDLSILLTAGDEDIQNRKADALGLRDYFDRVEIVPMGGKSDVLNNYTGDNDVVHVGNSSHSDLGAASDADAHFIYIPRGEWIENDNKYSGEGEMRTVTSITEAEEEIVDII